MQEHGQKCQRDRAESARDQGVFAARKLFEGALARNYRQPIQEVGADVLLVAVVIDATQPRGDLAEGRGILMRHAAVDE